MRADLSGGNFIQFTNPPHGMCSHFERPGAPIKIFKRAYITRLVPVEEGGRGWEGFRCRDHFSCRARNQDYCDTGFISRESVHQARGKFNAVCSKNKRRRCGIVLMKSSNRETVKSTFHTSIIFTLLPVVSFILGCCLTSRLFNYAMWKAGCYKP